MLEKFQVFLSSPKKDFENERHAAMDAILMANHIPMGMEWFNDNHESNCLVMKKHIDESDVYLLVLGGVYGSIDPETKKSYTEIEYDYAIKKNKYIVVFLIAEEISKTAAQSLSTEGYSSLVIFRKKVLHRHSKMWSSIEDLKTIIVAFLNLLAKEKIPTCWVRKDKNNPDGISSDTLHRISKNFHGINHLYRDNIADILNGTISSSKRNFDQLEQHVTQLVCQKINSIFSLLIGGKCVVTIYKFSDADKNGVQAFIRCPDDSRGGPTHQESEKIYSVAEEKNTAFCTALRQNTSGPPYFLSSNLINDKSYRTERVNHLEHYKAQIVVPIRHKENMDTKGDVIGFLGIDTLLTDKLNNCSHSQMALAFADQMYGFILLRMKNTA